MLLSHIHNSNRCCYFWQTHMLTLIIFICVHLLRNVCAFLSFILHYPAVILGAQDDTPVSQSPTFNYPVIDCSLSFRTETTRTGKALRIKRCWTKHRTLGFSHLIMPHDVSFLRAGPWSKHEHKGTPSLSLWMLRLLLWRDVSHKPRPNTYPNSLICLIARIKVCGRLVLSVKVLR